MLVLSIVLGDDFVYLVWQGDGFVGLGVELQCCCFVFGVDDVWFVGMFQCDLGFEVGVVGVVDVVFCDDFVWCFQLVIEVVEGVDNDWFLFVWVGWCVDLCQLVYVCDFQVVEVECVVDVVYCIYVVLVYGDVVFVGQFFCGGDDIFYGVMFSLVVMWLMSWCSDVIFVCSRVIFLLCGIVVIVVCLIEVIGLYSR